MLRRSLVVLTALLLAAAAMPAAPPAPTVSAQEETPEPGPDAAASLPDPAVLGAGWSLADTVSPDIIARYNFTMSPDVFREGAAGTYLGPGGARVVIVTLLLTDNRVAIRKSWEDATALLDAIAYRVSTDYERNEQLEQMDPPAACVEAKRAEGVEQIYLVPFGATMCAIDPDVVVIVAVSGAALDATGIDASDAVLGLMAQADV